MNEAIRLMDELGYVWSPVPGKQQLPGEAAAYYHIIHHPEGSTRPPERHYAHRFHNLRQMLGYLRAVKRGDDHYIQSSAWLEE